MPITHTTVSSATAVTSQFKKNLKINEKDQLTTKSFQASNDIYQRALR